MKRLIKIGVSVAVLFATVGCNDGFLERIPRHQISSESFFANANDLKVYTDGMYKHINFSLSDEICDNVTGYANSNDLVNMLAGSLSPLNVGSSVWDWEPIRHVNYFLEHCHKAQGLSEEINHYVGIGHFFRAKLYYDKVKMFGNVPWFDKALNDADPELYKTQDSREFVVDKIMADLEFAVHNILEGGHKSRVGKTAAYTLYARIALHEGTFRKYHGMKDADKFLAKARDMAKSALDMPKYALSNPTNLTSGYNTLFNSEELADNSEIILFREHKQGLTKFTALTVLDHSWGLSKDLVDSYLMRDGSRFRDQSGYATKAFGEIFTNRDARLKQTVVNPGWVDPKPALPYIITPNFGGFGQIKFYPSNRDGCEYYTCTSDIPIMRLAEPMLIYAEAKAELGTITDADLNLTINKLRERGGLPPMTVANANSNVDSYEAAKFTNVTGTNQGVILEIRRERRIELACEGFRYDDLLRWKAGSLMATTQAGMYIPGYGAYDINGDGVEDIAILKDVNTTAPIDGLSQEVKDKLIIYPIKKSDGTETNIYIQGANSAEGKGNIAFVQMRDHPFSWQNKYYYWPIPEQQIRLNKNLVQTW